MVRRPGPVDLLHQMPVHFHQARVQRIALGEILKIGKFDAGVEVVGAGLKNIQATARTLGGDQRLKIRDRRARASSSSISFWNCVRGAAAALTPQDRQSRRAQFLEGKFRKKLLGSCFVVVPAIGPEEFREGKNLARTQRDRPPRQDARRSAPGRASGAVRIARLDRRLWGQWRWRPGKANMPAPAGAG